MPSYTVTIKMQRHMGRLLWMAIDDNNDWRSYCEAADAETAAEAIRSMFHADEIVRIWYEGDNTKAEIASA